LREWKITRDTFPRPWFLSLNHWQFGSFFIQFFFNW